MLALTDLRQPATLSCYLCKEGSVTARKKGTWAPQDTGPKVGGRNREDSPTPAAGFAKCPAELSTRTGPAQVRTVCTSSDAQVITAIRKETSLVASARW